MSEYFNETMDRLAYWMEGNRDAILQTQLSIDGEEKYTLTYSWSKSRQHACYGSIKVEAKEMLGEKVYRFYLNAGIGKPLLYLWNNNVPKELVNRLVELFGAVTK